MQVPSAAVEGAAKGGAVATAMLKKANDLQSQDLEVINSVAPQKSPSLPGMGQGVDVSA